MDGPTGGRADGGGGAATEIARGFTEQHRGQHRGRAPDPPHRRRREGHHHRAGQIRRSRRCDAVPVQQRQHFALHQRAVADGVLGLDEELDGPIPVQDEGNQVVEREQARVAVAAVRAPAGMPRPVVEFAQLRQCHLADQSGPVGRPIHPPVVHAHQVPVSGQPNIAFNTVGAFFEGQFIGGQSVLRTFGRCAPVRHHERMATERAVARVHTAMLPGSALQTQPQRPVRARVLGLLLAGWGDLVAHDHPALGLPLYRPTLETKEHLQGQQQRRQRKQIGDDGGHGVVRDALRILGEARRDREHRHRGAEDPHDPPHHDWPAQPCQPLFNIGQLDHEHLAPRPDSPAAQGNPRATPIPSVDPRGGGARTPRPAGRSASWSAPPRWPPP